MQFNDGSQLVVQAGVSCITYTSPDGKITKYEKRRQVTCLCVQSDFLKFLLLLLCLLHRYKENEKLPEHVKEKLHCLSTILGLLANPTAGHLQAH